jgi:hypothetical protein
MLLQNVRITAHFHTLKITQNINNTIVQFLPRCCLHIPIINEFIGCNFLNLNSHALKHLPFPKETLPMMSFCLPITSHQLAISPISKTEQKNDNLAVDYETIQHGQSGNSANTCNTVTSLLEKINGTFTPHSSPKVYDSFCNNQYHYMYF